jgi:hypothetical protein
VPDPGAVLTIRFRHFWSGFEPHEFFVPFVARVSGRPVQVVTIPSVAVDVEIDSVFEPGPGVSSRWRRGRTEPPGTARLRLWFTGENLRPPVAPYDATFGFDLDDYGGTNAYLPIAFLGLDWFGGDVPPTHLGEAQRIGARPSPDELAAHRDLRDDRPLFACTFIGRPESTRTRAIDALREVGRVDVFGSAVGRPVASKADVATDYRFMLCFENDVYPGYVTEKAPQAWWCGCVPIWRGSDRAGLLNPAALLNLDEVDGIAALVAEVAQVDASPQRWRAMQSEPIAASPWSLASAERLLAAHLRRTGLLVT